jgi:MFS family permease
VGGFPHDGVLTGGARPTDRSGTPAAVRVVVGSAPGAVGALASAASPAVRLLLLGRFLQGLGMALTVPAAPEVISGSPWGWSSVVS